MSRVCLSGASKMPLIVEAAVPDIRQRLWTLYWLVRLLPARVVVELGVRQGDSTRALLAACEDTGAILDSYDTEDCVAAVAAASTRAGLAWPMKASWTFCQRHSVEAGKIRGGPNVDLVFVDTYHTLQNTMDEIAAWSPHVRIGGCMVFHDYWLDRPPEDGVKKAVDAFYDRHLGEWRLETHDAQNDTGLAILWRDK